jgi:hypothetical protein
MAGHRDRGSEAAVLVQPAQRMALAGREHRRRLGKALGVERLVQLGPGKSGDFAEGWSWPPSNARRRAGVRR